MYGYYELTATIQLIKHHQIINGTFIV